MGIIPGGAHANRNYYQQWLAGCSEVPTDMEMLIAATPRAIEAIQRTMQERGYTLPCAIIGEITNGNRSMIELA